MLCPADRLHAQVGNQFYDNYALNGGAGVLVTVGVGRHLTQIFGECSNIGDDALPGRAQIFEQPSISIGQIKTRFVITNVFKYIEVADTGETML